LLASEAIDGAALALGRAAAANNAGGRLRFALGCTHWRWRQVLVEQPPGPRIAAAFGERRHLENTDRAVERDCNDVARFHGVARGRNPRTVHPHVARTGKRSRRRARPHDTGVP
jgi:hypothetical protein